MCFHFDMVMALRVWIGSRFCTVAHFGAKPARRGRAAGMVLGLALLLPLFGCGSLPAREPAPPSATRIAAAPSTLAAIAQASTPSPELSGFRLLPHGAYALDARMELVQRAQDTLDVQYYVLENDATGRLLLRSLRDAAGRGVRVRLLVDDLFTTHSQPLLSDLQAHPNIEVRLFNPFCCARESGLGGRAAASLFDLPRLNHRMHNKLLVADGVMAVVGGRNIADEYFLRNERQNFIDMDALVLGEVVPRLSGYFDEYWNSEVVFPLERIVAPADDAATRLARFDAATRDDAAPPQLPDADVLGYGPVGEELADGRLGLIWAPARAYADPPDKRSKTSDQASRHSLRNQAMMTLWRAESELTITSPYLIPGERGMAAFRELGRKPVKMMVLTNSLASTDEPIVHTGYSRYRMPLLDAGVDLYELSPQRTTKERRLGLFRSSTGRLHAKTAIVDRRTVFIGSMNLDPRSETQNTEIGVFIDSPALARELQRVINISRLQSAYRVRKAPDGAGLQWLAIEDHREVVLEEEPESSPWMRLYNMLVMPLVPEELL